MKHRHSAILGVTLLVAILMPVRVASAGFREGDWFPQGLLQAQERILAAIDRQECRLLERCERKIAKLEERFEECLLFGDPSKAAKIEARIARELERLDQQLEKLAKRREEIERKFSEKLAAWLGDDSEGDEPENPEDPADPDEPPPPPEDGDPVVH